MASLPPTFLICTTARSGSNLLSDYLNHTGLVGKVGEAFNPNMIRPLWFGKQAASEGQVILPKYIDRLRSLHSAPSGIWGAKLLYEDLAALISLAPMQALMAESRMIFLRRRAKVSQAVSYFLAEATGRWVSTDVGRMDPTEVTYDFARLSRILELLTQQETRWLTYFEANKIAYLEVIYEDFIADARAGLEKILAFLGISFSNLIVETAFIEQKSAANQALRERFLQERWQVVPRSSVVYNSLTFSAE